LKDKVGLVDNTRGNTAEQVIGWNNMPRDSLITHDELSKRDILSRDLTNKNSQPAEQEED
jgi:hypothetical protein